MTAEGAQNLSQPYAIESAAYVLHSTAVCKQESISLLRTRQGIVCSKPGGGHSCVIGPDGRRLTKRLGNGPDGIKYLGPIGVGLDTLGGIIFADLDLTNCVTARGFLDIVGHYSRPDLLRLGVDSRQKEPVVSRGSVQYIDGGE